MIKKLAKYAKNYKKEAILAPICIAFEVLTEVFIPLVMAKIVDVGIENKDIAYILKYGALMIILSLFGLLFGYLSAKYASIAGMGFGAELRKDLFKKVTTFSFKNIDEFQTSSLVTRLTTDVNNTQSLFMMILRMFIRSPLMFICAIIMALSINTSLAWILAVTIPLLALVLVLTFKTAHPRFKIMLDKIDDVNAKVQEDLIGIRVIKAFVRSDYEKDKFEEVNNNLMNASIKAEKIVIINMPFMQLVVYIAIILVLWFGGKTVIVGNMGIGDLTAFVSYINQILMSLMMISMIFINSVLTRASIKRIVDVLDCDIDIKTNDSDLTVKNGKIEFKNVYFSYYNKMDKLVLENINLTINPGETIGILGGTGSSKSTLVGLIPRLYDVTSGEVLIDDINVKEYSLYNLREEVAMVLQKNVLFSGTIKENLKWGNKNATDEEIIECCKDACAHDFIMSFPNKYETDLSQGGVNVSGGQKQRLCIARALLKKPKILILDDSTSAVDTKTDALIRKSFKEKLNNTTKIIIAQRISSIEDADKIIVLDEGKIVGIGSHSELLKNNTIYQEVYESQMKGALE